MENLETPPVDENDPASTAVETTPDKIDLQKKSKRNPAKDSPRPDSPPQSKPTPAA